jgi:hypothetical protein
LSAGAAAATIAAAGIGATTEARAEQSATAGGEAREFYLLRRYQVASGPQPALTEQYFGKALIPALNRMGLKNIGAMRLDVGAGTPAFYLLVPGSSTEALATIEHKLADDAEFMKTAEPFWSASAKEPAFGRMESWLLSAFSGWPKLVPPKGGTTSKRIFQLRTYESPSQAAHLRKIEMFQSGEFEIFRQAGCESVFYGDELVGSRMPCLTYMLTFPNQAALEAGWDKFRAAPEWQKLSHMPKFSSEAIVSNITNEYLSPLSCSQI